MIRGRTPLTAALIGAAVDVSGLAHASSPTRRSQCGRRSPGLDWALLQSPPREWTEGRTTTLSVGLGLSAPRCGGLLGSRSLVDAAAPPVTSARRGALRRRDLLLALALGALSLASVSVRADSLDPVTISAPMVRDAGHEQMARVPMMKTTVAAAVKFDPVTLTTQAGVTRLEDSVEAAARRACGAAASPSLTRTSLGDQSCVLRVVEAAQPQVDAAIARARGNRKG
jgi:UrcA family protein